MPPHPSSNFEIQKYYENEPEFSGVYSRNNLPKIKDGAHVINLDEYELIGTHWITSHPVTRRRGDVITTSLYTSQRRRRYVSNKTPNDVSMKRRQDVSVVRLHDVLLERRDNVSGGRNNDVPSVRLHDASNKSQIKHPTTSQWYVSTTSH